MKNLFPLVLLSAVLAISACDETTNTKEEVLKDAANFEKGVSTAFDYNNGLVSQVSLLQAEYTKFDRITGADDFDMSNDDFSKRYTDAYNAFMKECNRVRGVVSSVKPVGKSAGAFRDAALKCINAYGELGALLAPDIVSVAISVNDESFFEDLDGAYNLVEETEDGYIAMNKTFCNNNDITLGETVDIEELAK